MYPQIFGKYVLEKELATGGMARVLLATLRGAGGFEKKLVVKQIRDELAVDYEFVQRFVEEAKTTVALSHPNIVPVYELGIEMGTYYLAMELVDGVSVDELLTRNEAGAKVGLSPEEGAYIGVEVCRALDYAHRRMQVVHRDITPRNVMVDEEGQVKIIDFGIAARASVAGQDVFGTPGHMPPEQLRREEIGPATDIFAVAVLLMELWSGNPPFRRKTPVDSLAQMHGPHPKPSGIDPRLAPLDAIMASAMALAKADRPQQADDLGRALRKFLADTDSGDIERKLGARVHAARVAAIEAAAKKKKRKDSLIKPSKPSMPDMGPRTFAVRAEVEEWKPEAPREGESGGTRRLPSSVHPPADVAAETGPSVISGKKLDEEEAPKIETIATRPIETPIGPPPGSEVPAKRGRFLAILAAVLVVPLAVWGAMRTTEPPPPTKTSTGEAPTPTAVSTGTAPEDGGATAIPSPTPIPSSATAAPSIGSPVLPIPTPVTPTPSTTAAAEAPRMGYLMVVGDPSGVEASVDGQGRRPCPFPLAVPQGTHHVVFEFVDTHEKIERDITIGAGQHQTMRGDFTGGNGPQIKYH
jgi:eukaryotic-like serine/threonine-protein kinase